MIKPGVFQLNDTLIIAKLNTQRTCPKGQSLLDAFQLYDTLIVAE